MACRNWLAAFNMMHRHGSLQETEISICPSENATHPAVATIMSVGLFTPQLSYHPAESWTQTAEGALGIQKHIRMEALLYRKVIFRSPFHKHQLQELSLYTCNIVECSCSLLRLLKIVLYYHEVHNPPFGELVHGLGPPTTVPNLRPKQQQVHHHHLVHLLPQYGCRLLRVPRWIPSKWLGSDGPVAVPPRLPRTGV